MIHPFPLAGDAPQVKFFSFPHKKKAKKKMKIKAR